MMTVMTPIHQAGNDNNNDDNGNDDNDEDQSVTYRYRSGNCSFFYGIETGIGTN